MSQTAAVTTGRSSSRPGAASPSAAASTTFCRAGVSRTCAVPAVDAAPARPKKIDEGPECLADIQGVARGTAAGASWIFRGRVVARPKKIDAAPAAADVRATRKGNVDGGSASAPAARAVHEAPKRVALHHLLQLGLERRGLLRRPLGARAAALEAQALGGSAEEARVAVLDADGDF